VACCILPWPDSAPCALHSAAAARARVLYFKLPHCYLVFPCNRGAAAALCVEADTTAPPPRAGPGLVAARRGGVPGARAAVRADIPVGPARRARGAGVCGPGLRAWGALQQLGLPVRAPQHLFSRERHQVSTAPDLTAPHLSVDPAKLSHQAPSSCILTSLLLHSHRHVLIIPNFWRFWQVRGAI